MTISYALLMFCYICSIVIQDNRKHKMITFTRRLYNWCRRFRHRCGYGVHSPSDFFLITSVIYENYSYYAYKELKRGVCCKRNRYRTKVYRLLFRLINYYTPESVIDIACDGGISMSYMKAASKKLTCYSLSDTKDDEVVNRLAQLLDEMDKIDCLHIGFTPYYKEIFDKAIDHVNEKSIIIVCNPYSSDKKREWWNNLQRDNRVVLTFDLYDIGIILFPKDRYKQNYIVNFL